MEKIKEKKMGKIFYILGKSATGKDTIYSELLADRTLELKPIVIYTTRPIRDGEEEGVTYFYTDEAGLEKIRKEGRLIELRSYNTVYGIWKYFTAANEQIDPAHGNYAAIGVLDSFLAMRDYYGPETVIPIFIEVEDGERLIRAIRREQQQETPKYKEMCRRFLTDSEDFSEENIEKAGIRRRFQNIKKEECLREIRNYIAEMKG